MSGSEVVPAGVVNKKLYLLVLAELARMTHRGGEASGESSRSGDLGDQAALHLMAHERHALERHLDSRYQELLLAKALLEKGWDGKTCTGFFGGEACGREIPEKRRQTRTGVLMCVKCQTKAEKLILGEVEPEESGLRVGQSFVGLSWLAPILVPA